MQTYQPKSLHRPFSINDSNGIGRSYPEYCKKLALCNFLQVFRPMQSFANGVTITLLYLWKMHKAGEEIGEEMITTELALWIGREQLQEEIIKHSQDYEEVMQIITNFLYSAEKEYYSGFYGLIRSFKEGKKIKTQSRYKKLI